MGTHWHVAGPVETDPLVGTVQRCLFCDEIVVRPEEGEHEVSVGRRIQGRCAGSLEARAEEAGWVAVAVASAAPSGEPLPPIEE